MSEEGPKSGTSSNIARGTLGGIVNESQTHSSLQSSYMEQISLLGHNQPSFLYLTGDAKMPNTKDPT